MLIDRGKKISYKELTGVDHDRLSHWKADVSRALRRTALKT